MITLICVGSGLILAAEVDPFIGLGLILLTLGAIHYEFSVLYQQPRESSGRDDANSTEAEHQQLPTVSRDSE